MKWGNTSYHYTISVIKGIVGGFQYSLDRKCNTKRWALMDLEELGTSNWGFSNLKTRLIDNAIREAIKYVKSTDISNCQVSTLYHSGFRHVPGYFKGLKETLTMTEIPTNQKNMERHMKAVESDRILNNIDSDIMGAAYELQDFMCDYDESEIRIIVTTDGITAERIEEEEDEY